jgi:hypothetical protein
MSAPSQEKCGYSVSSITRVCMTARKFILPKEQLHRHLSLFPSGAFAFYGDGCEAYHLRLSRRLTGDELVHILCAHYNV